MKKLSMITLLIVLGLFLGGATYPEYFFKLNFSSEENPALKMQPYEKEFDVQPGEELVIDLETGADIEVEGWDKNVVSVVYNVTGPDADKISVEIERTSSGVEITSRRSSHKNNIQTDESVTVKVPRVFDLEFSTMGGYVKLTGIEGELEGTTMGGEFILEDLKGNLSLTTMGGDISLTDSDVDGKVKTMGGDIMIDDIIGNVDASSMGGDIIHRNVMRRNGDVAGDEVSISTMGGNVEVDEAEHGAKVKTMGGDIKVKTVKKFLDASTMGGDIKVMSLDGKADVSTMGGDIEMTVTGSSFDESDIKMKSMGGTVELYVPSNFSMDVQIEIRYDKRHSEDAVVVSDYEFKEETRDAEKDWGKSTKILKASGSFNGGKNKVYIKTVNDKVVLKTK
ncbi:MAG: hypothetical protein K9J16_18195 [Melioribacteraceae bacterium]|nr:hypothetical protein [Melioribacteraceae bacterium]MCF8356790.1 hypothetical protein [Melioribacteraceae bacterium]MCF8396170.1 hypothetical protein [Melioribacteraceae bacterium]MCF8421133.1 hypothetical protein [Melioribacteraceae bacterium]